MFFVNGDGYVFIVIFKLVFVDVCFVGLLVIEYICMYLVVVVGIVIVRMWLLYVFELVFFVE